MAETAWLLSSAMIAKGAILFGSPRHSSWFDRSCCLYALFSTGDELCAPLASRVEAVRSGIPIGCCFVGFWRHSVVM